MEGPSKGDVPGGGALKFEWVLTAKRPPGAGAVNANSFWGKKGGGKLPTKNIRGALAYNSCLFSLYFIKTTLFFM